MTAHCKSYSLISFQGSKGNVSVRFDLYGESFCFVNAHLAAGDDYAAYRNQVLVVDYLNKWHINIDKC